MNFKLVLFVCVVMFASDAGAEECRPQRSAVDEYGVMSLGPATTEQLDSAATRSGCLLPQEQSCHWIDKRGYDYSWMDGTLEWKVAKVADLPVHAPLPLGLRREDTFQSTVKKIRSRYGIKLQTTINDARGIIASSGFCLKNKRGEVFELWFGFGPDQRIRSIGTHLDSLRDR
ncbi:MAG: hypothetical protein GC166_06470 [Alphaproteobacteria bacterium]|nr:hypothetical protein [Alphaproteobacteria bacterium]